MRMPLKAHFIILILTFSSFSFAAEMDLTRYWIQDRFIRSISLSKNDSEKLQAFQSLLYAIELHHNSNPKVVTINTPEELKKIRYTYLHPEISSRAEVNKFIEHTLPYDLVLRSNSDASDKEMTSITASYKSLIDYEFDFPPKNFKTQFLKFIGFLTERKVGIFDLLFENSKDSQMTLNALKKMKPDEVLFYLNKFHDQVRLHFDVVRNSGESILSMNKMTLKDPRADRFLNLVLQEYFKFLPDEAIWNFIFLQIENPEVKTPMARFQLFSRNVGPHFHKLFQLLAKNSEIPKELAQIFQSFEEDLPPAPSVLVKEIIKNSKFNNFEIIGFDPSPIKVGSMAQLHRSLVRFENGFETTLAMRVLKPGISEWVERDSHFLNHLMSLITQDPVLSSAAEGIDYNQLLSELKLLVNEEMNVELTVKNQNIARQELNERKYVSESGQHISYNVPKAYQSNNENVMAMEWVNGESFTEFANSNPTQGKEVAENLFKTWLDSVLFGGGFLHADLHAGNIKVEESKENGSIKVHILDFGMSGKMTETQQGNFILLAGAAAMNNYRIVARAIWEMSVKKPDMSIQDLEDLLKTNFQGNTSKFTFEKIIFFSMRHGFNFDSNFIKLVRGYAAVSSLLAHTKSDKKPKDFILSMLKENPKQAMKIFSSLKAINKEDIHGIFTSMGLGIKSYFESTKPEEIVSRGQEIFNQGKSLLGGLFKKINEKNFISTENKCLKAYKH